MYALFYLMLWLSVPSADSYAVDQIEQERELTEGTKQFEIDWIKPDNIIFKALKNGYDQHLICQKLLSFSANVLRKLNHQDNDDMETPLHLALHMQYSEVAKQLFQPYLTPDVFEPYSSVKADIVLLTIEEQVANPMEPPCETVEEKGKKEYFLRLLLLSLLRKKPLKGPMKGDTIVHILISKGQVDLVKALLVFLGPRHSLNLLTVQDANGRTPLHLAVIKEFVDVAMLLLEHEEGDEEYIAGALKMRDTCPESNQTPLDVAMRSSDVQNMESLASRMIDLCDLDTLVRTTDHQQYLPIHIAAKRNLHRLARKIVGKVKRDSGDWDMTTMMSSLTFRNELPFHLCASVDHTETFAEILEFLNERLCKQECSSGHSVLKIAVEYGNPDVVVAVSKKFPGCMVDLLKRTGRSPILEKEMLGRYDVAKSLVESIKHDREAVMALLGDNNGTSCSGRPGDSPPDTPVFLALSNGFTDFAFKLMKWALVNYSIDLFVRRCDQTYDTVLHQAIREGRPERALLLIKRFREYAKVELPCLKVQNRDGHTALQMAMDNAMNDDSSGSLSVLLTLLGDKGLQLMFVSAENSPLNLLLTQLQWATGTASWARVCRLEVLLVSLLTIGLNKWDVMTLLQPIEDAMPQLPLEKLPTLTLLRDLNTGSSLLFMALQYRKHSMFKRILESMKNGFVYDLCSDQSLGDEAEAVTLYSQQIFSFVQDTLFRQDMQMDQSFDFEEDPLLKPSLSLGFPPSPLCKMASSLSMDSPTSLSCDMSPSLSSDSLPARTFVRPPPLLLDSLPARSFVRPPPLSLDSLPAQSFDMQPPLSLDSPPFLLLSSQRITSFNSPAVHPINEVEDVMTGASILHLVASNTYSDSIDVLEYVLDEFATVVDVNAMDYTKRTPLHYAAVNDDTRILERLLQVPGVDVNFRRSGMATPLLDAVAAQCVPAVRTLLAVPGIDITLADLDDVSPMEEALRSGCVEIGMMLLQKQDELKASDESGHVWMDTLQDSELRQLDKDTVDVDAREPLSEPDMEFLRLVPMVHPQTHSALYRPLLWLRIVLSLLVSYDLCSLVWVCLKPVAFLSVLVLFIVTGAYLKLLLPVQLATAGAVSEAVYTFVDGGLEDHAHYTVWYAMFDDSPVFEASVAFLIVALGCSSAALISFLARYLYFWRRSAALQTRLNEYRRTSCYAWLHTAS